MLERRQSARRPWILVTLCLLVATPALATIRFGPLQISGNLQSQNGIRHPDWSTYELVQQRNVFRAQLQYDWLEAGKFLEKFRFPFIRESKLTLLYRGVYDTVYISTPGFEARQDIHGRAYGGITVRQLGKISCARRDPKNLARCLNYYDGILGLSSLSHGAREALAWENDLREAYVDFRFRDVPLQVRAGKQQIVWGETDNFRMLDRANSLDLTWHFQQEIPAPAYGWDEIRRPFWMLKFLYEIGNVGPISQSFLEWYWNPGDWAPAKQAFLPRPWGLPFLDPFTNPIDGAFLGGPCILGPHNRCTHLINHTELFTKGDWQRNPWSNSQVGIRYHGQMPFGMEFTLNYFYQRFAGDDGTNYAPLKTVLATGNVARDTKTLQRYVRDGTFPAEAYHPYVHTIGVSANYSDEAYTQTVFRMETIYDMGVPFFDVSKVGLVDNPALPGITKKEMWKGMVGFDRPTWIRWLNKKSTVFLTGQFFWHKIIDYNDCETTLPSGRTVRGAQDIAGLQPANRSRAGECLVGGLDLPSTLRNASVAFRDKIREWEALATFAAFTFYRGGSVIPTVGLAVDPVNQFSMEPFWAVDYVVKDWLVLNLSQRYFVTPRHTNEPIFETWGISGINKNRSETVLRITFQY